MTVDRGFTSVQEALEVLGSSGFDRIKSQALKVPDSPGPNIPDGPGPLPDNPPNLPADQCALAGAQMKPWRVSDMPADYRNFLKSLNVDMATPGVFFACTCPDGRPLYGYPLPRCNG